MEEETIEILWLFSHPMRLKLMELLGEKPMTVDQLTERMPILRASTNSHLQSVRNAGILISSDDRPVYHHLDKERLQEALDDFTESVGLTPGKRKRPAKKTKKKAKKPKKKRKR